MTDTVKNQANTEELAPQASAGVSHISVDSSAAQADDVSVEDQQAQLEQVAFIGDVFAPFFLQDPLTGCAGPSFAAMAALDPAAAAAEWPFVDAEAAESPLALMAQGAADATENLAREYRRLFVGPAHKAAPPWGSVYTDRECVMFGESTLELRRWMREHGLVAPEAPVPPRTISAFCWVSWRSSRRPHPQSSTNSWRSTCSPGRITSSPSWRRKRSTPSTRDWRSSPTQASKASAHHAASR